MATELGVGYVTVLPSMRGFGTALNNGISADVASAGEKAGTSFGGKLVGALGTAVKGASIGATIFGGLALKSGLERLTTIQNATTSLTTIMGDASKAAALMGEIKKTVQGTPFNLDQFADAGKNLVAMNIAGEKVPGILTAIGNAAATSGKGAEGVQQLVDVFGKMAAQGQVSLDQIWSISATGVPALQILANGFKTTTGEMKDMISSGAVPADKAIDILTQGIMNGSDGAAGATLAFGGAMEGLRQTFTGAFGGMKAAVARFGAAVLSPFMPLMTNAFTGAGKFLDTVAAKVTPVMEKAAAGLASLLAGLTGMDYAGVGAPLDDWVARGEKLREVLGTVKDGVVGIYQLVVNGDFTGAFARAFGVEEDSPVVGYILTVRDSVLKVVDSFKQIDTSSISSTVSGIGAAFGSVGGVFQTVKDNASTLKPAIDDLGTALGAAAGGGGVVLDNLLHILAGTLSFFADHTTLATAAILALTAGMAAQGPIMQAYHLAYAVRTPLMILQAALTWNQTRATSALTAALIANTAARGGNTAAENIGTFAKARAVALGYALATANAVGAAATWIATAATTAFGAALRFATGPIGLIITGIALLVGGLIWFFTKTETGKKIWSAVWSGIKAAAEAVVNWFVNTAWPFIQKVWDGIAAGATWLWQNVLSPVFSFIWSAFQVIGNVMMEVWTGFISPIFQLIGAIVSWLWSNILSIIFNLIKTEWEIVGGAIAWVWNNVLSPVIDALGKAFSWVWDNILSPVFGWIGDRWNEILLGMQIIWATVLSPALTAIGDAFNWLWNNVISPVLGFIKDGWDLLMAGIKSVWDTVLSPIFGSDGIISKAIGAVQTAFENVVSGVKTAWDKLIDIAKVPVKFVVNNVINDVFISGFNKLAGIFGTDPMDKIPLPDGFASGGYTGDGGKYQPMGVVHGGEFVFTKEQTARLGRAQLEALANSGVPGYAGGGFVADMFNVVKSKFPDASLNSGPRPGDPGYHGRGQAIDLGKTGVPGGNGNSYLAAMNAWIADNYGKKTAELIYDGVGDNRPDIKNGNAFTYDAATSAAHHNHVHWALDSLDALKGGGGGFFGAIGNAISGALDFLGGLNPIQWLTDKVNGVLGQVGSSGFAKFAAGLPKKLLSMVVDKFTGLFGGGSKPASSGGNLDSWIAQAMGVTHVPAVWANSLRTLIMRESGGNPNAINNWDSNAKNGDPSRGLMQTIGATFNRYRDPSLSDNIFDPVANIVAGINYIKARYGDISRVQQANPNLPPKGYDNGGWLPPGPTLVQNNTGRPEPVFNPKQWSQIGRAAGVSDGSYAAGTTATNLEVKVFIGDEEITNIVRTEIAVSDREKAVDAFAHGVTLSR